jgi:DNA-binding response OmpR family regulator
MLELMADDTPRRATAEPHSQAGPAARILIVESDPLLREILGAGLALHNPRYRTVPVADPAGAYLALVAAEFHLVLAGLDLPIRIDQIRFFERLREVIPHVPVLLLTESTPNEISEAVAYDALLPKPPDMDELLGQIDRLLRRPCPPDVFVPG